MPNSTILPTFSVNARGGQQQLARVDKILVVRVAFKTMPARVGFEAEEAALPGDRLWSGDPAMDAPPPLAE